MTYSAKVTKWEVPLSKIISRKVAFCLGLPYIPHMNATNPTPNAAPATCGIEDCGQPVCEPGNRDNRWAAHLCEKHVDVAFQCGGCDRWLPDTEYASGPCGGEDPTCEDCYKSGVNYYDPREAEREEAGRQLFLARSFGE